MFLIERPSVVERPAHNYDILTDLPVARKIVPTVQVKREPTMSERVPLGRLYEKMKNKRSKYLIGDLMQLSS
jgi:hypothetical protein